MSSVVEKETISAEILTLSLGNLKLSWTESAVVILFFREYHFRILEFALNAK